jgi:hypothetical protein
MPFTPGQSNPAPFQAFRFNIEPGQHTVFDGYGDFAYISEANGPLEIAVDNNTNFFPWDTALALYYAAPDAATGTPHYFRRISIKNAGTEMLTGVLYCGFRARVTDHRLHQLGEQKVSIEQLSTSVYENTVDLTDTAWHTVAASTAQIREVWLAVERVDGDEAAALPRAWWRASFGPDSLSPSKEIGLALDGITRLPFSGTIQVGTNAANAAGGQCRVRYWIVAKVPANQNAEIAGGADADEELVMPVLTSNTSAPGLSLGHWRCWTPDYLWHAFDGNPETGIAGGTNWELWVHLPAPVEISRIIVRSRPYQPGKWEVPIPDAIVIEHPNDTELVKANCVTPVEAGQPIVNMTFLPGQYVAKDICLAMRKAGGGGSGGFTEVEIYKKIS